MTTHKFETTEPSRARLSTRADLVRARMLARVDALDDRRDRLNRAVNQLTTTVKRQLPTIGAVTAVSLVGLGLIALVKRRRRPATFLSFLEAQVQPHQPGVLSRAARGAAGAIALRIVRSAGERLINNLLHSGSHHPATVPAPRVPSRTLPHG